MNTRAVTVTLPEWVWGRLATIAEDRQMKVSELIGSAIGGLLDGSSVRPRRAQPRVWSESDPDGRLKELMDEVNAARAAGWRAPHRSRGVVA